MKLIDLHGYTVDEAKYIVNNLLIELIIHKDKKCGIIRIVTGNGDIKGILIDELPYDWDVTISEELGNSGVLKIEWDYTI